MGLCNSLITACFAFLPEVSKKASENTQKIFLFSFHNKTCDVNPFTLKALATTVKICPPEIACPATGKWETVL